MDPELVRAIARIGGNLNQIARWLNTAQALWTVSAIEAVEVAMQLVAIERVYGKGDTASILGSCVTARIFGLGRAEFETANWVANALGDQTVLTRTRQSGSKSSGYSISEQRQKLMTADQILELKTGKMLLLSGSKPPAIIDRIISHRHPVYRGKLDRNPMV